MWPTEDAGMRRFAGGEVVCVFTGATTNDHRSVREAPASGRSLDTPPFLWPNAVVRVRRDVPHTEDLEAGRLERPNGRLPT